MLRTTSIRICPVPSHPEFQDVNLTIFYPLSSRPGAASGGICLLNSRCQVHIVVHRESPSRRGARFIHYGSIVFGYFHGYVYAHVFRFRIALFFAITADGGKTARCDVSVLEALSGHGYVDLGLSVRWAACNVGADSPEEYDAARAIWGAPWQLQTKAQVVELLETCEWKWTEMNGCRGYKVTGPNGNSIFLPAAGWIQGSSLLEEGSCGSYWAGERPDRNFQYGECLSVDGKDNYLTNLWKHRFCGVSVRPVIGPAE